MEELTQPRWRKSSHSGNGGSDCVEVARNLTGIVLVRDSKDQAGPELRLTGPAWSAFMQAVRRGEFGI
ncbi:MAG TPA: DUF397 domain-containing protein [Streptosporangiaceae bacterium]|nr:DUF397 domain-containing protein [Streptosporangiaceae bacterium]